MHATDLVPLLEALRANAPLDALVWDGAASHRDDALRTVGVPLIPLPPHSTELLLHSRAIDRGRDRGCV